MIDNRPKTFPKKKRRPEAEKIPILEVIPAEAVHSEAQKETPPPPPARPVRAKAASPLAGLMGGLGNLGNLGGGIGGILPVVLVVSALGRGRGTPVGAQARPQVSRSLPAVPGESLVTTAAADPPAAPAAPAAPSRPSRPSPSPAQIRSLLSDLSGYLPGAGNASIARISRIMGIADDLRTVNSAGDMIASSQSVDPLNRNIGLLNALSRNLPMGGASNLGRASQVLSMVNTFKGGGQNMGNMGNMAGMLRGMMAPAPSQDTGPQIKNVTPAQADGIKDTVNRLLSGMDDKQRSELLDKAKDFLGKK